MATITLTHDRLHLHLTVGERISGLHGDIDVPLAAVTGVRLVGDAFDAVTGLRSPGLAVPGVVRVGTWRKPGHRMFVVARRGMPALHITLAGVKPTDIVVSLPDAEAQLTALRAHLAIHDPEGFTERDVRVASAGVELAGTETAPTGEARAVAVILPGSGEVNRDADHRRIPLGVSRDLAHALAGAGVVTLRYDKRRGAVVPNEFVLALCYVFGAGLLFPLSLLVARAMKLDTFAKGNPLAPLAGLTGTLQLLFTPLMIGATFLVPAAVPWFLAVLVGAHFLPFSWLFASKAYVFAAIAMPVLASLTGWLLPGLVPIVAPASVVAVLIVTATLLARENAADRA